MCWDDENSVVSAMYAYSQYIELLCNNLILEYYSMRGNENGVLKKINQNREDKIVIPEVIYKI